MQATPTVEATVIINQYKPLNNEYGRLKAGHEATLRVLAQTKKELETAQQATKQALEQASELQEYGYQKGYQDGQARCGESKSYYDTEYNEK